MITIYGLIYMFKTYEKLKAQYQFFNFNQKFIIGDLNL